MKKQEGIKRSSKNSMACSLSALVFVSVAFAASGQSDTGILPREQWTAEYLTGPFPAGAVDRYNGPQNPNPQVPSKYELITGPGSREGVVAVHLSHLPGTDRYLYLSRPDCGPIAGSFDLIGRNWTIVDSSDSVFCAGHTITATGSVLVTGGHAMKYSCHKDIKDLKDYQRSQIEPDPKNLCKGKILLVRYRDGMSSIREYNARDVTKLAVVAQMKNPRWYPTATLMADGQVVIMGGTREPAKKDRNTMFEVFDPANPAAGTRQFAVEQQYLDQYPYNYYPFNYVLPTGDLFNFCMRISRIINPLTGTYRKVNGKYVAGPRKPGKATSQYPLSGTSVMTALRPPYNSVDVIIFGGSDNTRCDPNKVATSKSWRMTVTMAQPASGSGAEPQYSFSDWVEEEMQIPRVMADGTLLPNGHVIIQNGAQAGCAGDAGPYGSMKAKYPALWAQLYDTSKPVGQRFTILSASTVARLYHSTAALTTNGTILVAGCDRAGDATPGGANSVITDASWYQRPAQRNCEHRQEIFYPPYALDTAKQPRITSVNDNTNRGNIIKLTHGQELTLTWEGGVPVTDITLVAPSSTTHGFNMNQRVVFLEKLGSPANGKITVKIPSNPHVAPPQMYMVYALNGDYYGQSWWIQVVRS